MEGLFCLIGIIALIIGSRYIRCFFKRVICFFKLKLFCKRMKYKLYGTHLFWFLGSKYNRMCDFYVETKEDVYAVKFFAMLRRRSMLIFREDGTYFVRKFAGVLWIPFFWNSKLKPLVGYMFRYRYKDEWKGKRPHNILLVNPISMDIFRQAMNGYEEAVGLGDEMYGMKIYSLSCFMRTLEE